MMEEKILFIIEKSKSNEYINFISSKLSSLQSIKVKEKIVEILLSILTDKIEYNILNKKIFDGIPDDILSLRPLIWKICLNYLSLKPNEWKNILNKNRILYINNKKNIYQIYILKKIKQKILY